MIFVPADDELLGYGGGALLPLPRVDAGIYWWTLSFRLIPAHAVRR